MSLPWEFVWMTRPLPSRVGTYLTLLHTIVAPVAQRLSACFTATARGRVFESAGKQMFFCTKLNQIGFSRIHQDSIWASCSGCKGLDQEYSRILWKYPLAAG